MKNNHLKVEQLIQQAIRMCHDDFALEEAVLHLRRAVASVEDVDKKRNKKNSYTQRFKEQALKNRENWWNMIKENAKKSAETQLENREPL